MHNKEELTFSDMRKIIKAVKRAYPEFEWKRGGYEIIRKEKHTQEHFNDILDDITAYEHYCDEHPKYENNKAVLAIENIKRIYRRCEAENSFLIGN